MVQMNNKKNNMIFAFRLLEISVSVFLQYTVNIEVRFHLQYEIEFKVTILQK